MGRDNGNLYNGQGPLNTLKPQPGQTPYDKRDYHPLPGKWAQEQLQKSGQFESSAQTGSSSSKHPRNEIDRALAAERAQHEYWQEWQGVTPGRPVYEDPRAFQNTLLPVARFGTDGRGD